MGIKCALLQAQTPETLHALGTWTLLCTAQNVAAIHGPCRVARLLLAAVAHRMHLCGAMLSGALLLAGWRPSKGQAKLWEAKMAVLCTGSEVLALSGR